MGFPESKWCDATDPLALHFCFMNDTPPNRMGPSTDEEVVEMRIQPPVDECLVKLNRKVPPNQYIKGGAKQSDIIPWSIAPRKRPKVHQQASGHRPARSTGRFIIVCSFGILTGRVLTKYNTMRIPIHRELPYRGGHKLEDGPLTIPGYVAIWGRIVFDEFHNYKSEDTIIGMLYKDLRRYNHGYQWKAWAMSDTQ